VPGDGRAADGQAVGDLLHGTRLAGQQLDDLPAVGVAKSLHRISPASLHFHLEYRNGAVTVTNSLREDEAANPPALVCIVGKTELRYQLRAIEDLHAMLKKHGDWIPLGSADEQKPAADGTVEAWGRSPKNPVGGWYGMKKGLRGRFGMYMPPLLEALGLAEVEHNPKNNRMRAK